MNRAKAIAGACSILLSACSSPSTDVDVAVDAAATAPPDLRALHDLAHDMTRPPSVSVGGTIVDESGAPIANAFMSVCNPLGCRSASADESGLFHITGIPLLPFGVRSHDDDTVSPRTGTVVALLHPTESGQMFELGPMYVPSFGAGATLGAGAAPRTLAVGDGLLVTLVAADVEFPLGEESPTIAARRIPPEHVPAFDLAGDRLIAAWAFYPYSIKSKSPVALAAPIALPAGTEVRFRAVHEFEGQLAAPVVGHAAPDGQSVATDAGGGVDTLTWILISRSP